jgi:glutamate-ammonia-ligase adenylyltransferase
MRLRPSGRQGPVATSLDAFRAYQQDEAWTWEHLALTRARPIAGDPELGAEVEAFRRTLLPEKGRGPSVRADVAAMRARLQSAKPAANSWDAKNGPGRLMDIELMAQTAALLSGSPARRVEPQLRAGVKAGVITGEEEAVLLSTYRLCWRIQAAARLLSDQPLQPDTLGEGGCAFILRETEEASAAALSETLDAAVAAAEKVISGHLRDAGGA